MKRNELVDVDPDESGIGLIEIIISMFLLALLATAFLPILIQGMSTSVRTTTVATASQLAGQQLDQLRELGTTCSEVSVFDDVMLATTTDERGTVYQPRSLVAACPAIYPGVVSVRVWVTRNGVVQPLADATTLFYVKTANP